MTLSLPTLPRFLTVLVVFASSFIGSLMQANNGADRITWSAEDGYRSDEIDLSGLLPQEQQRILNWMNAARAAEEKGKHKKALKLYRRVLKRYPKNVYAPESAFRRAQIYLKRNEIDKAFEAFNLIAWVYPNYGSFNETIGEMYKIAMERKDTYRDKLFWVFPGFKNTDRAVQYFERIVSIAPYGDYAPLSLMNIAKIWDSKDNEAMTIFALDRLVTHYPNSFLTSDAYLKLAQTHYKLVRGPEYDQRATENSITFFEDFLIQYPENDDVKQAEIGLQGAENVLSLSKLKMADFYNFKRSKYEAANVLYNEAITIAPKSKAADIARKRLERVEVLIAKNDETEADAPDSEEIQKDARKRAKRRILGIF